MAAQLLDLEGEHIEVVQSSAAGKRGIISDAELDMLLDRRKEVFEGRRVGWKSGKAARSGVKNSSSSSRASTVSPRVVARMAACSRCTRLLWMRETTYLRICLERRSLYEPSRTDVERNLCVTLFSINPRFLIPPAVYHDGYYLDPFFLVLYVSSSTLFIYFSC